MKRFSLIVLLCCLCLIFGACTANNTPTPAVSDSTENTSLEATITPQSEQTVIETKENHVEMDNVEHTLLIPTLDFKPLPTPDSEALTFTKNLGLGINLGNTFDAVVPDGITYDDLLFVERSWVGITTSPEMIQTMKEAGFQTLRIPVSWHDHVDEQFTIDEDWLNRVQEVVDYAYDRDMNVIINIHHDNELDFLYPSYALQEQSKTYIARIWTQLSERFKDYDQRLIFEAMNEPRLKGTSNEWWIDINKSSSTEPLDVINLLNQTFVDVVRKSGGQNSERYLMIPSYAASPEFTQTEKFKLPHDSATKKLILSVHSYSPYYFALASPKDKKSVATFDHNNILSTKDIDYFMDNVYAHYIKNGIPVVIGEFGSRDKDGNTQERVNHAAYYANAAAMRGIPIVWWDNHYFEGDGERFGLLNRFELTWTYPEIVQALRQYVLK